MKNILRLFTPFAFVMILAAAQASAQKAACPTVKFFNEPIVAVEDMGLFSATLNGGDNSSKPVYNWSSSTGKISSSGSDGSLAFLDTKGLTAGGTVKVTVNVEGFNCKVSASTTVTLGPKVACPIVSVSAPSTGVAAGRSVTYSVNVSGGDTEVTPTYNWTVSAGMISSGQGTPVITLEDTKGLAGQTVTATVDVGGFRRDCPMSNSATVSITGTVPPTTKFDEYGALPLQAEKARLDKLAMRLATDPAAVMYLIHYSGKTAADDATSAADRATDYLMTVKNVAAERLFVGAGGYREAISLEFFIGYRGGDPPMATPTIKPSDLQSPSQTPPAKPGVKTQR